MPKPPEATEAFPVGEYVAEELEARGWSTAYAATLIDGDPEENELWIELLCCLPMWEKHDIKFSESDANWLEQLFGVSSQTWLNLHAAYLKARKERNDVSKS